MSAHLPVLVLLLPVAGALVAAPAALFAPALSRFLSGLSLLACLSALVGSFPRLLDRGDWHYALSGWAPPWGVELVLTPFSALFASTVLLISIAALFMSGKRHPRNPGSRWPARFVPSLHLVLTASLLGLVLTRDAFTLFIFLQTAVLAGAGLLAAQDPKNWLNAFRFLIGGGLSASIFLLGLVYLYSGTGTVHLNDLQAQLFATKNYSLALAGGALIAASFAAMFVFPLPSLFPRLMGLTPPYLTGFLVSAWTRTGAFLLFYLIFFTVNVPGSTFPSWLTGVEYTAAVLFLAGFALIVRQKDFHVILGYLGTAQLGYLIFGMVLGNKSALTGTLLELIGQSLAMAGLFLIAANLKSGAGPQPLSRMAGLARHRPLTGIAIVVLTASIVGIPPTGGFFGKFYLAQGALEKKDWIVLAAIGAAAAFALVTFTRLALFLYEHKPPSLSHGPAGLFPQMPGLLLALAVLVLGIFHQEIVHNFIEPALPRAFQNIPMPNVPFLGKEVE